MRETLTSIHTEEALVGAFARQSLDDPSLRSICGAETVDWDRVAQLCFEQGVLPMVVHHRRSTPVSYVAILSNRVEALSLLRCLALKRHTDRCLGQLVELSALLKAKDIRTVVLKGPGLHRSVYTVGAGFRCFGDLYLLFRTADLSVAHEVLTDTGYSPVWPNVARSAEENALCFHLSPYAPPSSDWPTVEMHNTAQYFGVDLGCLFDEALDTGEGYCIPNIVDMFIHVCLHSYQHRPERVADLTEYFPIVRHFVDIRETMLALASSGNNEQAVVSRISELDSLAPVVRSVREAEWVLGSFCNWEWYKQMQDAQAPDPFSWRSDHLAVCSSRFIFDRFAVYRELRSDFGDRRKAGVVGHAVPCPRGSPGATGDLPRKNDFDAAVPCSIDNDHGDPRDFWGTKTWYLLGATERPFAGSVRFLWDDGYLYLRLLVSLPPDCIRCAATPPRPYWINYPAFSFELLVGESLRAAPKMYAFLPSHGPSHRVIEHLVRKVAVVQTAADSVV